MIQGSAPGAISADHSKELSLLQFASDCRSIVSLSFDIVCSSSFLLLVPHEGCDI